MRQQIIAIIERFANLPAFLHEYVRKFGATDFFKGLISAHGCGVSTVGA